jgi:hypothetical protein
MDAAESLRASDVEAIRALGLDFILSFDSVLADRGLNFGARHGVWAFQGGYDAGLPCFWAIYRGEPTVSAALVRLTATPRNTILLREGHLKVVDYWYGRCVDKLCFEMARWPAYVARELACGVTQRTTATPIPDRLRELRVPSNIATMKFLFVVGRNVVRRLLQRRRREEWNIGVARVRPDELLAGAPLENVQWLPAIAGGWVADPMAMPSNGNVHVLCEEMMFHSGKGRISTISFDGSTWTQPEVAIETSTHASYPYLFEHNGEIYCIPETYEAREIALYRASEFPTRWQRVATVLSGVPAVDATLFEHDGLFWLFYVTSENSDAVLHGLYTEDFLKGWTSHPANPLKIDVRGSRPAGSPFRVGDALYRPAQDCSRTYGGRVVIHRVLSLTATEFREEPCAVVEPVSGTYGCGLHTLSFAGEFCVIDGKRWARR